MSRKVDLSYMADEWTSPVVARSKVGDFSGGVIGPKYIANLDSLGLGPAGRFRCGRKIVYDKKKLIRWLEERSEIPGVKPGETE